MLDVSPSLGSFPDEPERIEDVANRLWNELACADESLHRFRANLRQRQLSEERNQVKADVSFLARLASRTQPCKQHS